MRHSVTEGCPAGMYPTGTEHITYQNEAKGLAELREMVEDTLGPLNFPLGWWFSDSEADERHFVIVIWMPRKMQTWSVRIAEFDRTEVQRWLDTTIKESVNDWYGWHERETKAAAWDEGFTRGFYDVLAGGDRDASESAAENPYRGLAP